jgi:hypothetical protein
MENSFRSKSAINENKDSFVEAIGNVAIAYDTICSIYGQSLSYSDKSEQSLLREASEKLIETLTLLKQTQGALNG